VLRSDLGVVEDDVKCGSLFFGGPSRKWEARSQLFAVEAAAPLPVRSASDQARDAFELFLRVEIDDDLATIPALDPDQDGRAEALMEMLFQLDHMRRLSTRRG